MNRQKIARELLAVARDVVALAGTQNAFLDPERGKITFSVEFAPLSGESTDTDPDFLIAVENLKEAIKKSRVRGFRFGKPRLAYKGGRHYAAIVAKGRPFDKNEMVQNLSRFVVTV